MPRTLMLTLLLLGACCCGSAGAKDYVPAFDPHYQPDPKTDEGGLWYQMSKVESEVKHSPQRIADGNLDRYIGELGCRLAGEYCGSIRVYLVRNPNFNAMMFPNGMMIVWSGLLLRTSNEAQVAAVLGHEISHFLLAHSITQWRATRSSAAGAMVLDVILAAATGVYSGVATLGAMGSLQSFSREYEADADLYGMQLMTHAGYAPLQAAELWDFIIRESANDRTKAGYNAFLASHPRSEQRARELRAAATGIAGAEALRTGTEEYVRVLGENYFDIMQDHIRLQDFGQTEVLLAHHRDMGLPAATIDFFEAEMYRMRHAEGDSARAVAAYRRSLAGTDPPAACARELGYLLTKLRDPEAEKYLRLYLEQNPAASDREMVSFYLQSLANQGTVKP